MSTSTSTMKGDQKPSALANPTGTNESSASKYWKKIRNKFVTASREPKNKPFSSVKPPSKTQASEITGKPKDEKNESDPLLTTFSYGLEEEEKEEEEIITSPDKTKKIIFQRSKIVDADKVHGFDNDLMLLWKLLQGEGNIKDGFKAIGVVGRCGVGKSTLCRVLLQKTEVKEQFLPRIFVSMMEISVSMSARSTEKEDPKVSLVKRMLRGLGVEEEDFDPPIPESDKLSRLLYALYLQLRGKKYLIVLDGANEIEKWHENLSSRLDDTSKLGYLLAYGLPKGDGGRVIVTSRNEEVAKKMVGSDRNVHRLLPLKDAESCWKIFMQELEGEGGRAIYSPKTLNSKDGELIKKECLDKCGGLPLGAKLMGKYKLEEKFETDRCWAFYKKEFDSLGLSFNSHNLEEEKEKLWKKCNGDPSKARTLGRKEVCWTLYKRAFEAQDIALNPKNLEEAKEELWNKCNGDPSKAEEMARKKLSELRFDHGQGIFA